MNSKRTVSLVLSSGGSRGLTQIGAIEALLQNGYSVQSVAGCSIGSLVGGMFAAGNLHTLKDFFMNMDKLRMLQLTDFSISSTHLMRGERLMKEIEAMIPNANIEDLPIPITIIATDIITGQEITFEKGELSKLIRASISIPLVFEPFSYQGHLLMDGGITNPLPINRVKRTQDDILVAVNVSAIDTLSHNNNATIANLNYIKTLDRVTDIMVWQNTLLMQQLYQPDILMQVPFNKYGSYEFDHAKEIIAYGYDLMCKEIQTFEEKEKQKKPNNSFKKRLQSFLHNRIT